jgi:hypothetical protein
MMKILPERGSTLKRGLAASAFMSASRRGELGAGGLGHQHMRGPGESYSDVILRLVADAGSERDACAR